MKTQIFIPRTTRWPLAKRVTASCDPRVLLLVGLLLTLPALAWAQFNFVTNNGAIIITGYTGPGVTVVIPQTTNGFPVTSIGTYAFQFSDATSVTIPDTVTNIGGDAFYGCGSLTNLVLGNGVTTIGSFAFEYCTALSSIVIPNGVTSIAYGTFQYCFKLSSVTLPDSVNDVGIRAFFDCVSLERVTLPNNVTNIGNSAFCFCSGLLGVYFRGNAPGIGSEVFLYDNKATVYCLPGSNGWGQTFGDLPIELWRPVIETNNGAFGVRTNGFGFNIIWASGMVVVVEASTNLAAPGWSPLQTNVLAGDSLYFSDSEWTNYPLRFYRLRSP
jgi:hypothetical protein